MPTHIPCAAHTLNLVGGADVQKYVANLPLNDQEKKTFRSTFAPVNKLLEKVHRSTLAADKMVEVSMVAFHFKYLSQFKQLIFLFPPGTWFPTCAKKFDPLEFDF